MIPETLSVLAHASRGGWSPGGDDQWRVDRGSGLLLVASGAGPTYGGYHAPFGLDFGLDEMERAFSRSCDPEPARLLGAVAAADTTMKGLESEYQRVREAEGFRSPDDRLGAALRAAERVRPARWRHVRSFCHFAGEVTACSVQEGGTVCFAQVGGGRAYLLRRGELRVLVKDHTLATGMAEAGEPDAAASALAYHRHVVTMVLGMSERLEPKHAIERLEPEDRVLLCTQGAWNHDDGETLVRRLLTAPPEELRTLLDSSAQKRRSDAAVLRLTAASG